MLRAACAAVLAVALASASTQPLAQPTAWQDASGKGSCVVHKGALYLGTGDGDTYLLGVEGVRFGAQRMVVIDSEAFTLRFQSVEDGIAAVLEPDVLAKVASGQRLLIDWPQEKALDIDLAGLTPALNQLAACGVKLRTKAERGARMRDKLLGLSEALRERPAGSGLPPAPGRSSGGACFLKREWASGFNKNCVYDCLGSEAVQTIGAMQLCPLTSTH